MRKVVIIDDNRDFRERLATFVDQLPGCLVVGVGIDAAPGLELIRATRPDIALVDVNLPGENGFWVTERIAELGLGVKVVLMSVGEPEEYANAAARVGAVAYIPKWCMAGDLPAVLRSIASSTAVRPAIDGPLSFLRSETETAGWPSVTSGASPVRAAAATATLGRSAPTDLDGAYAGAAFLGFAMFGEPITGAAAAVAVLFHSHWQVALSRVCRGQAGERGLRRGRPR